MERLYRSNEIPESMRKKDVNGTIELVVKQINFRLNIHIQRLRILCTKFQTYGNGFFSCWVNQNVLLYFPSKSVYSRRHFEILTCNKLTLTHGLFYLF